MAICPKLTPASLELATPLEEMALEGKQANGHTSEGHGADGRHEDGWDEGDHQPLIDEHVADVDVDVDVDNEDALIAQRAGVVPF